MPFSLTQNFGACELSLLAASGEFDPPRRNRRERRRRRVRRADQRR